MKYASIEEGRNASGLRLILCAGTPGVWGEAIKAICTYKNLDYLPVEQKPGQENPELLAWTGQDSAPVLVYNEQSPKITWESQLFLLEDLAPEPTIFPTAAEERAQHFGLVREIAGQNGIGWLRRLQTIKTSGGPEVHASLARLANKYGYSEATVTAADEQITEILNLLSDCLGDQDFYFGASPLALDFYSAIFMAVMFEPESADIIPMPEGMRWGFTQPFPCLDNIPDNLMAHRKRMLNQYIRTPLEF